jgi:hypothetical protein
MKSRALCEQAEKPRQPEAAEDDRENEKAADAEEKTAPDPKAAIERRPRLVLRPPRRPAFAMPA